MDVRPGTTEEVEITVTADRTADAMGNRGVRVLSTPHLIALFEEAALTLIQRHLPAGASSVGTMVEMRHLAPTPVGMRVKVRATLLETDGKRFLFQVEAHDELEKVGEGKHERFVVPNLEKFLSRAMAKGKPGG